MSPVIYIYSYDIVVYYVDSFILKWNNEKNFYLNW